MQTSGERPATATTARVTSQTPEEGPQTIKPSIPGGSHCKSAIGGQARPQAGLRRKASRRKGRKGKEPSSSPVALFWSTCPVMMIILILLQNNLGSTTQATFSLLLAIAAALPAGVCDWGFAAEYHRRFAICV